MTAFLAQGAANSVADTFLSQGVTGAVIVVLLFVCKHLYGQVQTLQKEKFDLFREGLGTAAATNKLFEQIITLLSKRNGNGS